MIVCICHRVSERDIERQARQGCADFDQLQDEMRIATACGACVDCARDTFARARAAPVPCQLVARHVTAGVAPTAA